MSHPANPDETPSAPPAVDTLDLPRYGATFGEAFKLFFLKYGTFEGRASRSEYWWVMLLNVMVTSACFALMVVGGAISLIRVAPSCRMLPFPGCWYGSPLDRHVPPKFGPGHAPLPRRQLRRETYFVCWCLTSGCRSHWSLPRCPPNRKAHALTQTGHGHPPSGHPSSDTGLLVAQQLPRQHVGHRRAKRCWHYWHLGKLSHTGVPQKTCSSDKDRR